MAFDPSAEESASKLVSEPGAVATGPNHSAKIDDPVATALGSDTDSEALAITNRPLRGLKPVAVYESPPQVTVPQTNGQPRERSLLWCKPSRGC